MRTPAAVITSHTIGQARSFPRPTDRKCSLSRKITQTSGADWFDWNNWGVFDAQDTGNNNKQYGMTEQYTGKLDVKRVMNWAVPVDGKSQKDAKAVVSCVMSREAFMKYMTGSFRQAVPLFAKPLDDPYWNTATGKITVISARRRYARGSWQKVSHESLHDLDLNSHQDDRWEQLLAPYREELGRWPLYVSVDKDGLGFVSWPPHRHVGQAPGQAARLRQTTTLGLPPGSDRA